MLNIVGWCLVCPHFFFCVQLSSLELPTLFTIISVILGNWTVPVKRYLYGAHQEPLLHAAKKRPHGLSTNYHLLAWAGWNYKCTKWDEEQKVNRRTHTKKKQIHSKNLTKWIFCSKTSFYDFLHFGLKATRPASFRTFLIPFMQKWWDWQCKREIPSVTYYDSRRWGCPDGAASNREMWLGDYRYPRETPNENIHQWISLKIQWEQK